MSTADVAVIRSAVAVLREQAPNRGSWPGMHTWRAKESDNDDWGVICDVPVGEALIESTVVRDVDARIARWIATVSPALAEPLASLLEGIALCLEGDPVTPVRGRRDAVRVARLIVGAVQR